MTGLEQALIVGLLTGGVYGLFSAGLSLAFGVLRIVNFAHGDFVMLGMYLAYYTTSLFHLSVYWAVPIAAVGGVVVGVPVYFLIFKGAHRGEDHSQLLLALALSVLIEAIAQNVFGSQTRALNALTMASWSVGPLHLPKPQVIAFVVAVAVTIAVELFLSRTRAGRTVRAVVADREVAETLGVRSGRTFVWGFALSIALAGIAGAVLFGYLPVTYTTGQNFALIGFICVVLGGIGDIRGAFIAGLIVGVSESLIGTYWNTAVQDVGAYAIFVIGIVLFPRGILGRAVVTDA
jgi:branched-chain amino acid transport system permease protein